MGCIWGGRKSNITPRNAFKAIKNGFQIFRKSFVFLKIQRILQKFKLHFWRLNGQFCEFCRPYDPPQIWGIFGWVLRGTKSPEMTLRLSKMGLKILNFFKNKLHYEFQKSFVFFVLHKFWVSHLDFDIRPNRMYSSASTK